MLRQGISEKFAKQCPDNKLFVDWDDDIFLVEEVEF
jgi:hypothetical protein